MLAHHQGNHEEDDEDQKFPIQYNQSLLPEPEGYFGQVIRGGEVGGGQRWSWQKKRGLKKIFLAKLLHLGGEKPHQSVERVVHLQESAARSHFQINGEELDKYLINSTILHSASLGIYLRQTSASMGQSGLRVKLKIVSTFPPQGAGRLGRGGGKWFGFQETTSCEWRRERGKLPKQKNRHKNEKNGGGAGSGFPPTASRAGLGGGKTFLPVGERAWRLLQACNLLLCFGVASDLSALHNFLLYRRSQESFEEAWVMMAVEELPLNGSLALYQAD